MTSISNNTPGGKDRRLADPCMPSSCYSVQCLLHTSDAPKGPLTKSFSKHEFFAESTGKSANFVIICSLLFLFAKNI